MLIQLHVALVLVSRKLWERPKDRVIFTCHHSSLHTSRKLQIFRCKIFPVKNSVTRSEDFSDENYLLSHTHLKCKNRFFYLYNVKKSRTSEGPTGPCSNSWTNELSRRTWAHLITDRHRRLIWECEVNIRPNHRRCWSLVTIFRKPTDPRWTTGDEWMNDCTCTTANTGSCLGI